MGNTLIKQEGISFARRVLGLRDSTPVELLPLGARGSDRSFFRLAWSPHHSAILIHYDPNRQENCYYAGLAEFLHHINVPVPRIIGHAPEMHLIVMEDLGDIDLWSMRDADADQRKPLYLQTINAVQRLHCFPEKEFPFDRVSLMAEFDAGMYRWERDYFRQYFVGGVCAIHLDPEFAVFVETELAHLAERLIDGPRCLVHRDLQSQNVMIHDGRPVLIDFQGMRFGNPFYDVGSLLYDPYMELTDTERNDYLLSHYRLSAWDCEWADFQRRFWEASTQRLMQALGAYGFLALSRGLAGFLNHVPAGFRNLSLAASNLDLPYFQRLLTSCQAAWMAREKTSQARAL